MSFPNSDIRKGNACTCLHKPGKEAEVADACDTPEIAERMVLLCEHLLQNRARSGIRLPANQVFAPQFFQPHGSPCKGVVIAAQAGERFSPVKKAAEFTARKKPSTSAKSSAPRRSISRI